MVLRPRHVRYSLKATFISAVCSSALRELISLVDGWQAFREEVLLQVASGRRFEAVNARVDLDEQRLLFPGRNDEGIHGEDRIALILELESFQSWTVVRAPIVRVGLAATQGADAVAPHTSGPCRSGSDQNRSSGAPVLRRCRAWSWSPPPTADT